MNYIMLADQKFYHDGIRPTQYKKGQIVENPQPDLVKSFCIDFSPPIMKIYEGEAILKQDTQGAGDDIPELIARAEWDNKGNLDLKSVDLYEDKLFAVHDSKSGNLPDGKEVVEFFQGKGFTAEDALEFLNSTDWEKIKSWKHAANYYMKK